MDPAQYLASTTRNLSVKVALAEFAKHGMITRVHDAATLGRGKLGTSAAAAKPPTFDQVLSKASPGAHAGPGAYHAANH
ncbi:hypothetical protein HaLaN_20472, partial [Haematococcus lacustris]